MPQDIEKIANIALKAGDILLRNGGEIYRVEDTIQKICENFEIKSDVFVLTTGIFLTVSDGEKSCTLTKRITSRTNNFKKLADINTFSRRLSYDKLTYAQADEILKNIDEEKTYKPVLIALSYSVLAMLFAFFYSNSIIDAAVALVMGFIVYCTMQFSQMRVKINIFSYFISGMVSSIISVLALKIFSDVNIYIVNISALMMLLPGVALTNGLRDALNGDMISGISRIFEGLVWVLALCAGVFFILTVTGNM